MKEHVGLRLIKDTAFKVLICLLAFASALPLFLILYHITKNGIAVINWSFLFNLPRPFGETGGGIASAIVGTMMLVVLSGIISIPFGIATGIYLSERRQSSEPWNRTRIYIVYRILL